MSTCKVSLLPSLCYRRQTSGVHNLHQVVAASPPNRRCRAFPHRLDRRALESYDLRTLLAFARNSHRNRSLPAGRCVGKVLALKVATSSNSNLHNRDSASVEPPFKLAHPTDWTRTSLESIMAGRNVIPINFVGVEPTASSPVRALHKIH